MIVKAPPLYLQVEDYVRSRILSGEFAAGSRLPSTMELAGLTGTSVFTVQTALARLAGEGLLHRKARCATRVRGGNKLLSSAAIYFNRPFFRADLGFYQMLARELERRLNIIDVRSRVWIDERPEKLQTKPVLSLKHAIQRREVQALIAPLICEDNLAWLNNVGVPVALATTDPHRANGIFSDPEEIIALAVGQLRRSGCKSVGLIHNMQVQEGRCAHHAAFEEAFRKLAAKAGMALREEWISRPTGDYSEASQGYGQFLALWKSAHRPDGLFVYPDGLASGVITAILEQGIDVPNELRLIFYANDRLPFPCPLSAGFIVSRVGDYADALIASARIQLDGLQPKATRVSPVFMTENPWEHERPQPLSLAS